MATFTWLGGSGTFTSNNWSISGPAAGSSPGTADTALLNGTGIYTVSSVYPTPLSVHGLTITDPGANLLVGSEVVVTNTLLVSAGTLSIANGDLFLGAKVLENDGVIYSDNLGASTTKVVPSQFINNGSIYINGDTIDISPAPSTNSGIIRVENNGLFQVGEGLSGTGSVELDSGGTVDYGFPSGVSQIGTVDFLDGAGDVYVDETYITLGSTPAAIVQNFQPGDTIDLTGLDPTLNTDLQVGVSGGSIDVMSNSTLLEAIPEVGLPNSATLSIGPDSGSGTQITACYVKGTRILTTRGEVAVENLVLGDPVVANRSGGCSHIRWIGSRHIKHIPSGRAHDLCPVRIRAHAFAVGMPRRDLWLSPDHAVFTDGVLIPIRYLINGRTVIQEPVAEVSYYHLELPFHDVIMAEGLPCESYLDTGNRAAFVNSGSTVMLHPDFARSVWAAKGCAELVLGGQRLVDVKRRLLREAIAAGHKVTQKANLRVLVDGRRIDAEVMGKTWHVRLPTSAKSVRLVSRSWVPAHMRADEDDTRSLGVAISALRLDGRTVLHENSVLRSGWHGPEPEWRWTNGNAELAVCGPRQLEFDVAIVGSYWKRASNARTHGSPPQQANLMSG